MTWWYRQLVLVFVFSAAVCGAASAAPLPEQLKSLWHTDFERAKDIARQQGKPLLIVFR